MFQVKRGMKRTVVLLPGIGVVLKFPRFFFRAAWESCAKRLFVLIWRRKWREVRVLIGHPDKFNTVSGNLFEGIYNNWLEFVFFAKSRHGFCQPTYFSFFGLMNIQKYGTLVTSRYMGRIFFSQIHPAIEGALSNDPHHFTEAKNFTVTGDRLLLVDYGSRVTRKILIERRRELEAIRV